MMKYVMVLFGLSLVSSAYADEGVIQIDKSKLMRVADTLGVVRTIYIYFFYFHQRCVPISIAKEQKDRPLAVRRTVPSLRVSPGEYTSVSLTPSISASLDSRKHTH